MNFRVFIDAQFVVGIHIKVIAGIRLPENQIEHFKKRFHVSESKIIHVVKFGKVIHYISATDFVYITVSKPIPYMIFPNAILL